ncbi:MAG: hypothetical protein P4L85_21640 [Paludisphaera borealis]|uniref:hypothetical protein n=1 Tax=Paludisphaera borealis TaxID=1387353 RepID=UPI0028503F46|nr:hypothetical protein [Paludisphaera borealis]MDR3621968.1 hypothetical protein [Paludisphaera borealis]
MIRLSAIAALLVLSAALAGCGGGEAAPNDVSQLPELSAEERDAMTQHDSAVADEEKATMLLTPAEKGSKRSSKKRVDPTSAEAERF